MKNIALFLACLALAFRAATAAPSILTSATPVVPSALAGQPGSVELLIKLNAHGYVTEAKVKSSTDARLEAPCLAAIRQWRYAVDRQTEASFIQPFHFGGELIDTAPIASARPTISHQVAPEVPAELARVSGEVTVSFGIDPAGQVTAVSIVKSTHEELNAACLAAAKQWSFTPAINAGQPVACTAYVPFKFVGQPAAASAAPATELPLADNHQLVPVRQSAPALPADLAAVKGDAVIDITVDNHGYVAAAAVKSASNPALGEASRQAVLAWKFRPIVKDGVAVSVRAVQPFHFEGGSVTTVVVDRQAAIKHSVSPELPAELEGASGFAKVLFVVDATGHVTDATVIESSHESFKAAVAAVAKEWTFTPAMQGGQPVSTRVAVPFIFGQPLARN